MSTPPQPPPPPPEPPPQQPDEFAINIRSRPMQIPSRPASRPDKAPRLALLLATILWPVLAIGCGAFRYAQVKSRAGDYFAREASYEAVSGVTSLYFLAVLICLAWWFYVKD